MSDYRMNMNCTISKFDVNNQHINLTKLDIITKIYTIIKH